MGNAVCCMGSARCVVHCDMHEEWVMLLEAAMLLQLNMTYDLTCIQKLWSA